MTKQEAIELENKCDELMSKYLQEECTMSMALTGKLKVGFGSNYFTLDMDEKVASYVKYHGYYDMLEFYIESAIKCVDENKDIFKELLWSYEYITELE
jgi:hypothetical protein